MARWTIDEPTKLDFDGVVALKTNIVMGSVSILPTDDTPSMQISEISGHPLQVAHEAGMLTLTQKGGGLDGVLRWLQNTKGHVVVTITVPKECPVSLNLGLAQAMVTGLSSRVSVKSASGGVTLDGVTGTVHASTATGDVECQGVGGSVTLNSVSGDLSLAHCTVDRLNAHSVTGRITADVDLRGDGSAQLNTVSGEVTTRLPAATSARVYLTSLGGRIDSAFEQLTPREGTVPRTVAGTLGGGAGKLIVHSASGAITLLRRPAPQALAHQER